MDTAEEDRQFGIGVTLASLQQARNLRYPTDEAAEIPHWDGGKNFICQLQKERKHTQPNGSVPPLLSISHKSREILVSLNAEPVWLGNRLPVEGRSTDLRIPSLLAIQLSWQPTLTKDHLPTNKMWERRAWAEHRHARVSYHRKFNIKLTSFNFNNFRLAVLLWIHACHNVLFW